MSLSLDANNFLANFRAQDRQALARLITLIESTHSQDRALAAQILTELEHKQKQAKSEKRALSMRMAISGPPGVGKSTLINRLAKKLVEKNKRVAVLAIDPSSEISGGSILGDKTRMAELLNIPEIYIRPSASRGDLGGVNSASLDIIFALEAFGFNNIILETVGVGQSETLAYSISDIFLVLIQPGSGDQLQAMKKGLLERADLLVINKHDGELASLAQASFNMLGNLSSTPSFLISALSGLGVDELVDSFLTKHQELVRDKQLIAKRAERLEKFVRFALENELITKLRDMFKLGEQSTKLSQEVASGLAFMPQLAIRVEQIITQINFLQVPKKK